MWYRWERDVLVIFEGGDRYWVDVYHGWPMSKAVIRNWRSEVPMGVYTFHSSWIYGFQRNRWAEEVMSFLKRKAVGDQAKAKAQTALHAKWLKDHPALGEYLTAEEYPDGGKRQTATILIFVEGGDVKLCLRDRDSDQSLWVTSGSVPEGLDDLEACLQGEEPPWRKNQAWGGGGKKKK